jgi:hypothetical protein
MPPGEAGVDHPKLAFERPEAVTTDSFGDIYVSNEEGAIDIFDSSGDFLAEFDDPEGAQALAVDSLGNLYVGHRSVKNPKIGVSLFEPTVYKPEEGLIEYGDTPKEIVPGNIGGAFYGLAIDPSNDSLYLKLSNSVRLYKSAGEGSGLVEEFEEGLGVLSGEPLGIAIDSARGRLAIGRFDKAECVCIRVVERAAPHNLLFTIKGSAVPAGKFIARAMSIAIDEETGHIFLYDSGASKVYEFDPAGSYLDTIGHSFREVDGAQIAVDNGAESPNGALSTEGRYLFVPSDGSGGGIGHSYAFGPSTECEPVVESTSFSNVGEAEAELEAVIEPCGLQTQYVFEFITQQEYESNGKSFTGAQAAGGGEIPAGTSPASVSAAASELEPGTTYVFRAVASNAEGSDAGEGEFATYPVAEPVLSCPNDIFRAGFSAHLPDCRAYELVTPSSTNARAPTGVNGNLGSFFPSREASPDGSAASFEIYGGSLPGSEATGSLAGDPYLAQRDASGWNTSYVGPNGLEAPAILPGSHSPDQSYSFWNSDDERGSASIEGKKTSYIRYPDGQSKLVGRGSIAGDPEARSLLIGPNGSHIVFASRVQLESNAPPDGTMAVYDRTPDEATHVVSLLPGGKTPKAGEDAVYQNASIDGKGIAFRIKVDETLYLYLRYNNEETYEVGEDVTFAGIAEGGSRVFYLEDGDIWRYDVLAGTRIPFTTIGNVTPVNISADGTVVYFVSPTAIGGTANPSSVKPVKGAENLYRSDEGGVSFVGTVTERDVVGVKENYPVGGLGLWLEAMGNGGVLSGSIAIDPSRTTPDGNVLLFESRAVLDGYDPEGHAEVYRYDFTGDTLDCLSCNPTLAPATSDASLQSILQSLPALGGQQALSIFSNLPNLIPDGRRVFFQSLEALVPDDTDGLQDVYEWEAQGVGSCTKGGGCISLISSGQSMRINYLFAISDSGNDVFVRTSDLLLPSDLEETPSIYDARVDGGFAEEPQSPLRTTPLSPQPTLVTPGMLPSKKSGNVNSPKRCPKGKKKVRRHGKFVCVKKKHHKKHHRTAGKNEKGGRK